jgi:hypothetical protein
VSAILFELETNMSSHHLKPFSVVAAVIWLTGAAVAQTHVPPAASADLLRGVDFSKAKPVDEEYRKQFVACDGDAPGEVGKNKFRGFTLSGNYRCSTDPSRIKVLLKLADGAIYWESKMALDVDGSWAAWSGTKWTNSQGQVIKTTDLCGTSLKWGPVPGGNDCKHPEAQVDPDRFPFVVIPTNGIKKITGDAHTKLGAEFRDKTGLDMRDIGVAILKGKWTPVFIADGGPFMRLGEGSPRVFEAFGESRCKKWSGDGKRCVGPGGTVYPYRNFGVSKDVVFILYPKSGKADMTLDNAIARICDFAREKLGLTGSPNCPG